MHCTKMHHFCGLKFASRHAICIYCIICMHPTHASCMLRPTHNHLCIVIGFPPPFTHLSGTLLPLHCISEILISLHDHCISKDLHPTPYHGILISLHCISGIFRSEEH